MELALTLVSPQAPAAAAALAQLTSALAGAQARVKEPRPLGPGALEVLVEAQALAPVREAVVALEPALLRL
ncbi:MAG TPA: hypothetical protein PKB04_09320, partial [Phenylobacterium sp.]|nr:hypothetical protein [Phenylobacterium sp.]